MSVSKLSHLQRKRRQPPQRHEAYTDRFLAIAQECADVFWLLTPEGAMSEVSVSWHTFTEQEKSQSLGRGWLDVLHPADQQHMETTLLHSVTSGHLASMECRLRRHEGAGKCPTK